MTNATNMKKVCLLAATLALGTSLHAQKASLGFKASPGLAWIKSDSKELESDGSKIGFAYGVIFDLMFTENYGLGSGLFIQHQGGKLKIPGVDSTGAPAIAGLNYRLQYLNIPVTLKLRTNEIGYFRYYGQFGLTPGINLSAKGSTKISGNTSDFEDVKDDVKSFQTALVVGAGAMYNFAGNTSLLVGLEWNNSFSDIFDDSEANGKNNFLLLNVGVIF